MRIVVVLIVASILIFTITLSWYITLPMLIGISRALNETYYSDPNARNIALAVEYVSYAWGGLFDLFILLWAIVSASKYDVESERYGYG